MPVVPNVPVLLQGIPHWICWCYGRPKANGKRPKIPFDPKNGGEASVTASSTWSNLAAAQRAYANRGDGIGFVLTKDLGIVFIDYDHVRDPESGYIEDWVRDDLNLLRSYTEVSPSGEGVHVLTLARLGLPAAEGKRVGQVEMYEGSRYFTFTGDRLDEYPDDLRRAQGAVTRVRRRRLGTSLEPQRDSGVSRTAPTGYVSQLIDRIRRSKVGDHFERLFDRGDTSGYQSASEADFALCRFVAHFSSSPGVIDGVVRASALYRAKWDTKNGQSTYGMRTIESAVSTLAPSRSQHSQVRS